MNADKDVQVRLHKDGEYAKSFYFAFACCPLFIAGIIVVGHKAFRNVNELQPPILTFEQRNDFVTLGVFLSREKLGGSKMMIVPRISSS